MYLVPFLRYSASKNSVTLKNGLGLRVVQGHWRWRRSTFYWSPIVNIACTVFELFSSSRSDNFQRAVYVSETITLNNTVTLKYELEVTVGHTNCRTIRKLGCGFLFAYYGSIIHHFRDKTRYLSKIVIFYTPLHSTPPLGGFRRSIAITFGMQKLGWCGYPTVKKFWRYDYSFWQNVRTWQTDRHTPHAG